MSAETGWPPEYMAEVFDCLAALHDRGVLNELALVNVLQELRAERPLTRDHLTAIFGVEPISHLLVTPATSPDASHLESLDDIRETLIAAEDWEGVLRGTLQLVAWLRDERVSGIRWPFRRRTDRLIPPREGAA